MIDYFALLDELRRPWLDTEALKEKFLRLSSTIHPDRVHNLGELERASAGQDYAELNTAYNTLRDDKARLRHLLTLELGAPPTDIREIPQHLMDQFLEVGQLCKVADKIVSENAAATSPLLKVQFFERSQQQSEKLQELQKRLMAKRDALMVSLRQADEEWTLAPVNSPKRSELLAELADLHRLFSYFDRWLAQVQERIARLSF